MSIMLPFFRLRHIDILAVILCASWQILCLIEDLVEVFPDQVFQFQDALVGDRRNENNR